jgi:hypothetical protein
MKMLSLLTAALLTAMCFVGCASNGVITEIGTEESTATLQTEAPETEAPETEPAETEPPVKIERDDFTIKVKDDTYVVNSDGNGDQHDKNFDGEAIIDVKTSGSSYTRYGYVKFDISELVGNGEFTCIDLDLYISWRQKDAGNPEYARLEIYACDPSWKGSELTFNTQPAKWEVASSLNDVTDERTPRSFPVTSYVKKALENGMTEIAFLIEENTPKWFLRIFVISFKCFILDFFNAVIDKSI